jgi:class 3 adenylate cyclase
LDKFLLIMAKAITSTTKFASRGGNPAHGLALIYDLEGFSKFFNQPDVQDYVPKFLNHLSQAMSVVLLGGTAYWDSIHQKYEPLPAPIHEKFLGDGMLYVWRLKRNQLDFDPDFISGLCNRLWNLKVAFPEVLKKAADDVPVLDLPTRIRFGVARGTIYELTRASGTNKEYIGFCINLASRLQKYCADLGFIVSARLGLPAEFVAKQHYNRVVATKIRGFPEEIVIVDKQEYEALAEGHRTNLFRDL